MILERNRVHRFEGSWVQDPPFSAYSTSHFLPLVLPPSDGRTFSPPDGEVQLDMLDKALRILKLLRFLEHASYPKSSLSVG